MFNLDKTKSFSVSLFIYAFKDILHILRHQPAYIVKISHKKSLSEPFFVAYTAYNIFHQNLYLLSTSIFFKLQVIYFIYLLFQTFTFLMIIKLFILFAYVERNVLVPIIVFSPLLLTF